MAGLRVVIILSLFMVMTLPIIADEQTHSQASETSDDATNELAESERNRWCRTANGTYLSLGYSFLNTACSLCQCLRNRNIRCQPLQCMPTYCLDNSMPIRREGQCCTQCRYEQPASSCSYNNMTFPHGTIIKAIEDQIQCWCQLGNIECRDYMGTLMDSLMDGTAVYIIVIVLAVVLIFGCLFCCTCTLGFYYYYQRNQQVFQEAYEQYVTSSSWEPVEEGTEVAVDPVAEEKRIEAENSQFNSGIVDVVPPPYAIHNSSYVEEQEQK